MRRKIKKEENDDFGFTSKLIQKFVPTVKTL